MVKKVVGHVIAYVSEDPPAIARQCGVPVMRKYDMRDWPEGNSESGETRRRHDETIFVHG